jgi:alkanesulfonate monooxygenase SsuD/methylene tetrahydromethanopterin reductase-like flavin-dependent oxidoreductase (luciferase family)
MKASLFCTAQYMAPAADNIWPLSGKYFASDIAIRSMATTLEQFRRADEVGFDWLTVAEHHYSPMSLSPNPMVLAGALCQVAHRAKIAVLGPTIPILNPVRVAEELAMIDVLSGGRLVAGLMRGTANEYVTYNINPSESRERFAEAVHLIRRTWTESEPFGWAGKYYEYRTISIWPRPVQKPHPPIFMSASSPESGEFAAQNHLGVGFAFTTVPHAKKAVAHYRACARAAGWEPTADNVIYRALFHVADTDEQAFDDMATLSPRVNLTDQNKAVSEAARKSGYYGADITGQTQRNSRRELAERIELGQVIVGSPETALKQVRRIRDALGAGIVDFVVGVQLGERTMHSIELLGSKVLPRMRDSEASMHGSK